MADIAAAGCYKTLVGSAPMGANLPLEVRMDYPLLDDFTSFVYVTAYEDLCVWMAAFGAR